MFRWNELLSIDAVLAVVGMAKNVGKTVTMNYVQDYMHREQRTIGLLSIGLDGEQFDTLTHLPKPAVVVKNGTIVATAASMLREQAVWECLQKTGIPTPLGEVVIARATQENQVILAGPSKNSEVTKVVATLRSLGAERIIIDGAFGRQSTADPLVSHQVILATGATLSRDIHELVALTKCRVEQLTLSSGAHHLQNLETSRQAKVTLFRNNKQEEVALSGSLLNREQWEQLLQAPCEVLMVRGAVGDSLGEALLTSVCPPTVIVQDGCKIFMNPSLWRRLRQRQIQFRSERPIHVLGVTVNPVLPGSTGVDPDELLLRMGEALYPIPVIDIMRAKRFTP